MLPPAPPRLSTMTFWPSSGPIFCAIVRATMSTVPPAANGTRMVIGFVGHSCAPAGSAKARRKRKCLGIEPVSAHLVFIERHAQSGSARERQLAAREIELRGHDIVRGLQGTDALEPFDHGARRRGEHDLRHRVHAEPEAMADDHA